jgi:poly-gamma-glutamate capsule biosynthesis protein CapA/YwtB (metallophosphatase superfamily)
MYQALVLPARPGAASPMMTLMACGDVGVKRARPDSMFAHCAATLRGADIAFAQLETTVSERGAPVPNARLAMRAPPTTLSAIRSAGISVMSFAGNHCLDYGYDAFHDTLQHAAAADISLCGAGESLDAARRPLLRDVAGVRIAFFAACSILPEGYAAEAAKPGCAPLRAHTLYEQIEHDQPGTPARIKSFAHRADLQALCAAIQRVRGAVDLVLVSLHWGIHMVPATLADYQIEAAHTLIEAGADAIFGHHPHLLKGVEFHSGRPIFYSLGNFAIEQPHIWDPAITNAASFKNLVSLNPSWNLDQLYALPPVTRLSGIVKFIRQPDGRCQTRFLPAWIGDDSAPRVLRASDAHFAEVEAFLLASSREAGLNLAIARTGDELLLSGV